MNMRSVCLAAVVAVLLLLGVAQALEDLPANSGTALLQVGETSRFTHEPDYYNREDDDEDTGDDENASVDEGGNDDGDDDDDDDNNDGDDGDETQERASSPSQAQMQRSARMMRFRSPLPHAPAGPTGFPYPSSVFHSDIPGSPGYMLKPGNMAAPGGYFPPIMPYRFPSHPYDNPSYTPYPSMFNVPLPPPWRSDPLEINSDGARYQTNMQKFDYYPMGGAPGGAPAAPPAF